LSESHTNDIDIVPIIITVIITMKLFIGLYSK